jgi:drug/metabolite transporter (DMT)-like permease
MLETLALTCVAMCAFAANSLLTRAALGGHAIDAASFTTVRIVAGAVALLAVVSLTGGGKQRAGDWTTAAILFGYAIAFSYAYVSLSAGTGALILFGTVQITMLAPGFARGERLTRAAWIGFAAAIAGVAYLVSPGVTAPPLAGAALMALAGVGWGAYSLRGRGVADPLRANAGHFLRCVPLALGGSAAAAAAALGGGGAPLHATASGVALAVACGALTSGLGYVVWYRALAGLAASRAAIVQLSVPALAALGGVLFLGEALTPRLVLSSAAILGGIALVLAQRRRR